jgi:hypothetical protein
MNSSEPIQSIKDDKVINDYFRRQADFEQEGDEEISGED